MFHPEPSTAPLATATGPIEQTFGPSVREVSRDEAAAEIQTALDQGAPFAGAHSVAEKTFGYVMRDPLPDGVSPRLLIIETLPPDRTDALVIDTPLGEAHLMRCGFDPAEALTVYIGLDQTEAPQFRGRAFLLAPPGQEPRIVVALDYYTRSEYIYQETRGW